MADELGDAVALILDGGDCRVGIESTIVDLSRGVPVILRPGAISAEQLALVLGEAIGTRASMTEDVPRVSGSLASHYAPQTPMQIVASDVIERALQGTDRCAAIVRMGVDLEASLLQRPDVIVLADQPAAYAHAFYRVLRELDARGYARILVQALPEGTDWLAVQDRLGRAAHRD